MKWLSAILFLWCAAGLAQTVTIPAQTIVTPITINGTTVKITITVPGGVYTCTGCSGGSGLPSGMSYSSSTGLAVSGAVTATQINLTGGPTLPTCTSGLYLFQMVNGALTPACYTPVTVPAITVSQATSPINTLTFTP